MTGVLEGLREGDPIVVSDSQRRITHRTVAKVGRLWLTDNMGWKYLIATGQAEERLQYGASTKAMTEATWQDGEEERLLREVLRRWGFFPLATLPQPGYQLTRGQLRLVAALLEHFEDGDFRDVLSQPGTDFGFELVTEARRFASRLNRARDRVRIDRLVSEAKVRDVP
jgi:hypothetical protein